MRLRNEMDRTFERFFSDPFGLLDTPSQLAGAWIPPLDIKETDNEIEIRAEVPGIPAEELKVTLTGRTLQIEGEKEEESEERGDEFYQCERRFGSFRRSVELPDSTNPDTISADAENGLLTIRIAKKPGLKPKRVEVKPTGRRVPVSV